MNFDHVLEANDSFEFTSTVIFNSYRPHLHPRNHAPMHNDVLECERRSMVATLGLGPIFVAFPNRF